MARDCVAVMSSLGLSSFFICAHDRGARVAHKLLVDHPEKVKKAIFLDICPTLAMAGKTDEVFATAYWHWFFLSQKEPLPELMITGVDPRKWLELFMGGRGLGKGLQIFDVAAFGEYVKVFGEKEAVHSMCEDYRAALTVDVEEAKADIKEGRKIKCPLIVLWGKYGIVERCFDAVKEWQDVSESTVTGSSVESGHYIPEEAPETVVRHIMEFFK